MPSEMERRMNSSTRARGLAEMTNLFEALNRVVNADVGLRGEEDPFLWIAGEELEDELGDEGSFAGAGWAVNNEEILGGESVFDGCLLVGVHFLKEPAFGRLEISGLALLRV